MTTPLTIVERLPLIEACRKWWADLIPMNDKDGISENSAVQRLAAFVEDQAKSEIERLQALVAELEKSKGSVGYIYHNPDTGTEFSENHPVKSGEVDDAENIREATADVLRDELLEAWRAAEDETINNAENIEYIRKKNDAEIFSLKAKAEELEKRNGELVEGLRKLRLTAAILYQNAEGCAVNHHAADFEQQGLPGWLADCGRDIENARILLDGASEQ